jgi:hypothetical protein
MRCIDGMLSAFGKLSIAWFWGVSGSKENRQGSAREKMGKAKSGFLWAPYSQHFRDSVDRNAPPNSIL